MSSTSINRNEMKSVIKREYSECSSEDAIHQFVTGSLSPVTIIELYNCSSRTIHIFLYWWYSYVPLFNTAIKENAL